MGLRLKIKEKTQPAKAFSVSRIGMSDYGLKTYPERRAALAIVIKTFLCWSTNNFVF